MENIVLTSLEERRSVRKYLPKQVEEDKLAAILRAGTYAPTGMNRQSPMMVVVQDPQTRETLRKMNASVMGNPDSDPFYGAPTIVIVLADPNVRTAVEDGSLVMGNLMNAAHAVGMDSCWIHRAREEFASEEGKALLKKWGIEGEWIGIGHCILGYRDCDYPEKRERKDGWIVRV
ncbi:MAG: nitroreductase [Clostridia bacterium]|nr:nitroreductase [Clostridia bacterium]